MRRFTIIFSLFLAALFSIHNAVKADILITFNEVAGDVVASTSGTIQVPSTPTFFFGGPFLNGAPNQLSWLSSNVNRYGGGVNAGFSLNSTPTTGSGDFFGIEDSFIFFNNSLPLNSFHSPNTTWTWDSTDLTTIGLGALSQTPTLVYTASNGETVSFVSAIPEPSSFAFMGIGFLAYCMRRQKNATA